jgi:hypothetical protein
MMLPMKNSYNHVLWLSNKAESYGYFSEILGIKDFKVTHIATSDTELHLYLECELDSRICPRCGHSSQQVRQNYQRVVRDLPISGKACYLHVVKRYFDCPHCQETFGESLDFFEPQREYPTRYEESIFHQVRQTTASYVAQLEGLTDKVVTRIFLRQAKKRIPADPFKGICRLGLMRLLSEKAEMPMTLCSITSTPASRLRCWKIGRKRNCWPISRRFPSRSRAA